MAEPGDDWFDELSELIVAIEEPAVFCALAHSHRLSPLVARYDLVHKLPDNWHPGIVDSFWESWYANEIRVGELVDEALRISERLSQKYAITFTKGIVCQASLYGDVGLRKMSDIDLLVPAANQGGIRVDLVDAGYSERMVYRRRVGGLVPRDRADLLKYAVSPDHLPHFVRVAEQRGAMCRAFVLDVAFSLSWHNAKWKLTPDIIDDAGDKLEVQGLLAEGAIPALSPVNNFIFLCMHFFREAWFDSNALRLPQIADIVRCWVRISVDDRKLLKHRIASLGIGGPIGWAAYHIDEMFDIGLVHALSLSDFIADEWVASAVNKGRDVCRWHGDMRTRVIEGCVGELSSSPGVPFSSECLG
ncbi:nucleotidyltransferase family protein [Nocardia carnea]|uniref:nucleotidyltransferase family protein n=1 Tax=Nocardia carnea TaxID=37328 RepID=UPI002456216C|nr:nucleotidyltransferase family protein [Nocardia carnea]